LLRALLALLLEEGSGLSFYSAFPPAFLLGAALTFGLLLVSPARLQPPEYAPEATGIRPLVPAVALGSLAFALMHVLQNLVLNARGLFEAALIPPLALVAGAGLSAAVYDQPQAAWRVGIGRWFVRVAVPAATFALVQAVFALAQDYGSGLIFAWTGFFYRSRLHDNLIRWGLEGITATENWFHYAAVIDAALTGIAMALGVTTGLVFAAVQYQKWRSLIEQAGD
jgi:hypothetical protein